MSRVERVITKNKIDKRFFCPYCKADLRIHRINFTHHEEGNGYGDIFECGNCGRELDVGFKGILDKTELWD